MATSSRGPSLFAQRMKRAKECNASNSGAQSMDVGDQSHDFGAQSNLVSGPDAQQIHQENVDRLAAMLPLEIAEEREKLMSEMDPKLLEFLKARKKNDSRSSGGDARISNSEEMQHDQATMETESAMPSDVDELANQWPNMGTVEKDKVQWMKELPKPVPPPPDVPYNARFNFDGTLLPYADEELEDVRKGLHHHGEEPERPGYTLQELMQLSRSSVLQQRIMALNTLSNVLEKAHLYSECLDKPLLPLLLDADLFLLLRFSLDDPSRPIVTASLAALCNLLVNHSDEACLDSLLGCNGGIQQPSFNVRIEMDKNEQAELKDPQILKLDVIRGTLRTLILPRFRYILDKMNPESTEIVQILKCLIRIARHSYESSLAIVSCPGLLDAVRALLSCGQQNYYYPDALKLMRIISCRSESFVCIVMDKYKVMDPVLQCLAGERTEGQPEALRLMLESFYMWQTLLSYNLATAHISTFVPIIMKLLCVHTDHTGVGSSSGDQEHACALLSAMTTAFKVSFSEASSLLQPVLQAATKWISLILVTDAPTRSMCKLAGAALNCLSVLITKNISTAIESKLQQYFRSSLFTQAVSNVRLHSWLLNDANIGPSPENLPSLAAVPLNLRHDCTQPFIEGLAAFVLASNNHQLSDLFLRNPELEKYLQAFVNRGKITETASHLFAKQEIRLLCSIILINVNCQTIDNNLFHRTSLILTTAIQTDDRQLLAEVFDKTIFSLPFFRDHVLALTMEVNKLQLGSGERKSSSNSLLLDAIDKLPTIKQYYVSVLGLQLNPPSTLPPLTLTASEKGCEPVLPSDWQFLPILKLYNTEGRGDNAVNIATCSLEWLLILEHFHPEFSSITPLTARFSRVCCVFMAGCDLFRDVSTLLEEMLKVFLSRTETMDLESDVPGLNNFYDFYRELVDHYAAVSYGDHTFGQYVFVPLQQCHSVRFRKLIWSEQAPLVRVLSTPIEKLVFPFKNFLEPYETDLQLLASYLRFVAQGRVRPQWSPVLYKVAIHHVATYIKINPTHGFAKSLKQKIEALGNQELRTLLLEYSHQNGSETTCS